MIHDASTLAQPARIRADLCVVGSGPGGATVAGIAAEAGLNVVVLEAGGLITPRQMNQREEDMLPRLLWHAGARTSTNRAVHVHQGRGVGGSSLHNLNLCKRIPPEILRRWVRDRGLDDLDEHVWSALYDEVEALLSVTEVPRRLWNTHNQLLEAGCRELGWRHGPLSHNRTGCIGSGFCEVGCAYDAKNNALKVWVPRVVKAGGTILTHCQATIVRHRMGEVRGVEAVIVDPVTGAPTGRLTVEASVVCLSASATGTAAILQRSDVRDPGRETGNGLRIHPGVVAAGEFADPVNAWDGIPQTVECTQWLDLDREDGHRSWIIPAFAHPMGFAATLPGHGRQHRMLMDRYDRLAAFSAMLHDHTAGTVRPRGDLDVSIDYWSDAEDRRELALGLHACAEILFAAGAERVFVPADPLIVLERGDSTAALKDLELTPDTMDLVAVHPMASVPMGADPAVAAVSSTGRHHHLDGLWGADGSLFPTAIGVPPQLSIYALGLRVGRAIAAAGV